MTASSPAGPARRAADALVDDYPGLDVSIYAAAEWGETPGTFKAAEAAVMSGDMIISNLLFLEEHVARILPALNARRDGCDAMIGVIDDASVVKLLAGRVRRQCGGDGPLPTEALRQVRRMGCRPRSAGADRLSSMTPIWRAASPPIPPTCPAPKARSSPSGC